VAVVIFDPLFGKAQLLFYFLGCSLVNFGFEGGKMVFAPIEVSLVAIPELVEHIYAGIYFAHGLFSLFDAFPLALRFMLDVAELEGTDTRLSTQYFIVI